MCGVIIVVVAVGVGLPYVKKAIADWALGMEAPDPTRDDKHFSGRHWWTDLGAIRRAATVVRTNDVVFSGIARFAKRQLLGRH